MPVEVAYADLCKHNKAQLTRAQRDLSDVARKAAYAEQQGSTAKVAKLIELIQERKSEIAQIKEVFGINGPICRFCTERAWLAT